MRQLSTLRGAQPAHGLAAAPAVAVAVILALASASLSAQTAPAGDKAAAPQLEEIVVTATRHEESLSKVPLSVTAITQEGLDLRGIKDIQDVARFTPGINVDTSGTSNISIRGIASSGGAGTTGIYIDDTPIQMRALAFNPDEALPKSFDIERVEVLRGPQGTLFGAGSMGGTVRYITVQPSLTKSSVYSRGEISFTKGGDPSYEAGVAAGGPLVDGTFGARISAWYRKDGGWIDRYNPDTGALADKRANHSETALVRLAGIWAPSDTLTVTPGFYYQESKKNDVSNYWVGQGFSDPGNGHFVSFNPTQLYSPDKFYLPSLKFEGDFGAFKLISNTSYYHRDDSTGYDGTLYNLGFYQGQFPHLDATVMPARTLLLDGFGLHLTDPAYNPPGMPGTAGYRSPATVDNHQRNFTQEIRLQSADPNAPLVWTTGIFYSVNKQEYLEQIHDPQLGSFLQAVYNAYGATGAYGVGLPANPTPNDYITNFFGPGYDPLYPTDSYFLHTQAKDKQLAWFGEGSYAATDRLKVTVGARYARMKYSFDTLTGGPQLFDNTTPGSGSKSENAFTPKVGVSFQADPSNMYYVTYAKGFRPGGGNNPLPPVACATDFDAQHLNLPNGAPKTFDSDSTNSLEIGAKNNFGGRVRLASSVYLIKWHNIQQTVIPPICQISFISNLGEATAKGVDFQADIALSGSFTMEISAGYTDARYTQDSRLNANQILPVVASGDAIVGESHQPGAPFTGAIGIEYKFSAFEKESFVRLDYEHQGSPKWIGPGQDGKTAQNDVSNYLLPATNFATIRAGVALRAWTLAAFIDNLTNAHPTSNYDFTINPGNAADRIQRNYTFRPRTIGLSFTYRQ